MRTCSIDNCKKHYKETHKKEIAKYNKQYYKDNKEYFFQKRKQWLKDNSEYHKQWEQKNKEKRCKQKQQYYQDNKEYFVECDKQYRTEHKEQRIKWSKQYYQTPAGRASSKASRHNRRILKKGLTLAIVQRVYEANIAKYGRLTCILCGKSIVFGDDSLDHLTPLIRGGSNNYENLGIAHLICNKQKFTMTLQEWNKVNNQIKTKGDKKWQIQ